MINSTFSRLKFIGNFQSQVAKTQNVTTTTSPSLLVIEPSRSFTYTNNDVRFFYDSAGSNPFSITIARINDSNYTGFMGNFLVPAGKTIKVFYFDISCKVWLLEL